MLKLERSVISLSKLADDFGVRTWWRWMRALPTRGWWRTERPPALHGHNPQSAQSLADDRSGEYAPIAKSVSQQEGKNNCQGAGFQDCSHLRKQITARQG